jgi:hypothetical protein
LVVDHPLRVVDQEVEVLEVVVGLVEVDPLMVVDHPLRVVDQEVEVLEVAVLNEYVS